MTETHNTILEEREPGFHKCIMKFNSLFTNLKKEINLNFENVHKFLDQILEIMKKTRSIKGSWVSKRKLLMHWKKKIEDF